MDKNNWKEILNKKEIKMGMEGRHLILLSPKEGVYDDNEWSYLDEWFEKKLQEERKKTEALWKILDSIDTLPDMLHPKTGEDHEKVWKMMVKRAEGRHKILHSDGYNLSDTKK